MSRGVESTSSPPVVEGLLALSPDGVLVIDREGRVAAANENAARLLRRARKDLTGLALRALLADSGADIALAATPPGAPRRLDARGPRGERIPLDVTSAAAGSSRILALREPAAPAS